MTLLRKHANTCNGSWVIFYDEYQELLTGEEHW